MSWYGRVSSKVEDGHVLRRASDFDIEVQRRKGKSKEIWKIEIVEESMRLRLSIEDANCRS